MKLLTEFLYLEGTSEDDSLDEDLVNISINTAPHHLGSFPEQGKTKPQSFCKASEIIDKKDKVPLAQPSNKHENKSIQAVPKQDSQTAKQPVSAINKTLHSQDIQPLVLSKNEPNISSKKNISSIDVSTNKVAQKIEVKSDTRNPIATKPLATNINTSKESKDLPKCSSKNVDSTFKPLKEPVCDRKGELNLETRSTEDKAKIKNAQKAQSASNNVKTNSNIISTINAASDTSANSSANSALGDTQAKRLRTDSSSSYGSLYGGTNFTEHDATTIAAQIEKVPSPYRKMFETKSKVSLLF